MEVSVEVCVWRCVWRCVCGGVCVWRYGGLSNTTGKTSLTFLAHNFTENACAIGLHKNPQEFPISSSMS